MRARPGHLLIFWLLALFDPASAATAFVGEPSKESEASQIPTVQVEFSFTVRPLLAKYCASCHGPPLPKAGLNLTSFRDGNVARSHRKVWQLIVRSDLAGEVR
jgi:hypothetical protein